MLKYSLAPIALSLAILGLGGVAQAQDDETSIDIDVGSTRIGGPGASDSERRSKAAYEAPEEWITEETLPPKGNKKRLPGLHVLAKRYFGGQQWKEACERYDTILEEEGDPGLEVDPTGKSNASRSYLECARIHARTAEFDRAEVLLKKSERYGPSDYRHAAERRKMLLERYHAKLADGDVSTAISMFNEYQAERQDDDERIWLGQQLADRAWAAYKTKDEVTQKELMRHLETIAPMNTEYRRLKDTIASTEGVIQKALGLGAGALLLVFGLSWLNRWRAKQKLAKLAGGSNAFDDEY